MLRPNKETTNIHRSCTFLSYDEIASVNVCRSYILTVYYFKNGFSKGLIANEFPESNLRLIVAMKINL